jgi:hypothetical protein
MEVDGIFSRREAGDEERQAVAIARAVLARVRRRTGVGFVVLVVMLVEGDKLRAREQGRTGRIACRNSSIVAALWKMREDIGLRVLRGRERTGWPWLPAQLGEEVRNFAVLPKHPVMVSAAEF